MSKSDACTHNWQPYKLHSLPGIRYQIMCCKACGWLKTEAA